MTVNEIDATPKQFAFSYSALSSFEICPLRFYETRVATPRIWTEPPSIYLQEGNELHEAFAHALRTNSPLPDTYGMHQRWIDKFNAVPGKMLVEEKLAVTRDFEPTYWFNDNVWLRVVIDAGKVNPQYALAADWKTGRSENVQDNLQLTLTALALFIHYPEIRAVGCRYVWLRENRQTKHLVKYEQIGDKWQEILPRVAKLEEAHAKKRFPPKPGRYCKNWCCVKSCRFNGK